MQNENGTLSVNELMDYLRISRKTAYELVAKKDFPSFRIGKRILVSKERLKEWMKEQENNSSFPLSK